MPRAYVTHPYYDTLVQTDPQAAAELHRGWFDPDKAAIWPGRTEWDGQNITDLNTGDYGRSQYLYRTAGGRWVINTTSKYVGESQTYVWVSDEQAREWLIFNEHDDAVKTHLHDNVEEERGPGRPEIGRRIPVRLPDDLITVIDEHAGERQVSRAEMIRQMLTDWASTTSTPTQAATD